MGVNNTEIHVSIFVSIPVSTKYRNPKILIRIPLLEKLNWYGHGYRYSRKKMSSLLSIGYRVYSLIIKIQIFF